MYRGSWTVALDISKIFDQDCLCIESFLSEHSIYYIVCWHLIKNLSNHCWYTKGFCSVTNSVSFAYTQHFFPCTLSVKESNRQRFWRTLLIQVISTEFPSGSQKSGSKKTIGLATNITMDENIAIEVLYLF